jgi:class 3 adenylate cyclase/tetratricopeptide (TPR) repeat protein
MIGGPAGDPGRQGRDARLCQVSLLFSDLSGYTALAEGSDPEDVDLLRRAVSALAQRIIESHGGTLSQFFGDGLMAIFGLPQSHEDDGRRAVDAALELHQQVRALRAPASLVGFEARMHSGVDTGLVLARLGDMRNGQYELTGDAVNTAARLCALAGPDVLFASEGTLRGVDGLFRIEAIAPLAVKGKRRPVVAYQVLGRSQARTRFEARARRGLTPLVGRTGELERLKGAMADALQARNRIVGVVGPAGIGKTRLLDELTRWAADSDANIYRVGCDSYGNVAPFHPFLQLLRQLLDVRAEVPLAEATATVEGQLADLPGMAEHLPALLHLLSLRPWSGPASPSSDDAQRLIVGALVRLFVALAERRPLALIVDDWQWADDASRQVLIDLTAALRDRPAMIVVAARPLAHDPVLVNATVVELAPFSDDESRQAIGLLVPTALDLGLGATMHRRSGGNPLFLEELCQSLPALVSGTGEGLAGSGVPSTIHGLIQARIERLPADESQLLRVASVIGNEVPVWLLERVTILGPRFEATLGQLAASDLIHRTEREGTFRFKHEITREGVYRLIRREERRQLHGAVARALEERFGGAALAEHYEALAYHYAGSGDHPRALKYAELAGDKAAATSSLDRARLQYRAALLALDEMTDAGAGEPERDARWFGISMKWAATCVFSPDREQLEIMRRAAQYAERLSHPNVVAHAQYWVGWLHYALGEQERAIQHCERALPLAEQAGNQRLHAQLLANLGQSHAAAGEYERGLALLGEAVALKRRLAARSARREAPVGFCYALGCQAMIHADRGDFEPAARCLDEALGSIRHAGHAVEGSLLITSALAALWQSRWSDCIAGAALARAVAERVNGPYVFAMSEMASGYARWKLERVPPALVQLRRAVDWLESHGMGLYLSWCYANLAEALGEAGDEQGARDYAGRALARAERRDPIGEASAHRTLARLEPSGDRRRDHLDQARRSAGRRGSARDLAVTALVAGELALGAGHGVSAQPHLADALAGFRRLGMPGHLAVVERLLAGGGGA